MGRDPIVLVTGGSGQVGRALAELLPDARFCSKSELDVTDEVAVAAAMRGVGTVVHLAAMTAVDRCEDEPDLAREVNEMGTRHVATAAQRAGARVIYVSTDYVFDGKKATGYSEDDDVAPLNVYGRTKFGGEEAVRRVKDHLIVRSSWIFGSGKNFIDTVIDRASAGAALRVVDDQIARPTSATGLALALSDLIGRDVVGTLHVTGDGAPCSWADLASFALACAGFEDRIERVTTEDYRAAAPGTIAQRPANSTLALDKARRLSVPLLDWRTSVREHVRRAG